MNLNRFLLLLVSLSSVTGFAANSDSCAAVVYGQRAKEMQKILKEDQEDRKTLPLTAEALVRDTKRRMRVGEIFGEGCFLNAAEFAAAALVFQHGTVPEHFYQTFIWSKRAVELGDTTQKSLMGLGLDRYLVNRGKKQLFASQAFQLNGTCWCLQPVEKTFPDALRVEYTRRSLADSLKWVDELNKGRTCAAASECSTPLTPSPAGTVPGFW